MQEERVRREKREERREKRTELIYNAEKDTVALYLQFCAIATVKRSNAWQQKRTQASCKANPTQCCRRCTVTHRRTQMSIYMRVLVRLCECYMAIFAHTCNMRFSIAHARKHRSQCSTPGLWRNCDSSGNCDTR